MFLLSFSQRDHHEAEFRSLFPALVVFPQETETLKHSISLGQVQGGERAIKEKKSKKEQKGTMNTLLLW